MKKIFFISFITLTAVLLQPGTNCFAQNKPFTGSGKIVTRTFDYKNFDKLEIMDLNGKINVEVGKPFSITVAIDDNLEKLLMVSENNGELKMELKGNDYNKMYIEGTNINITVTMPEVSEVKQRSNSRMVINGITGRSFRIKNSGNGDVLLKGSIDELNIDCSGNGTIRAEELIAKSVKVNKSGNGNIYIKTDASFSANGSGNGDVINKGEGMPDSGSAINGNGEIKYKNQAQVHTNTIKKVTIEIQNETGRRVELTVKYPGKGSYGIDVKANGAIKESFPVGTRLFKGSQFTTFKTPLYEVTAKPNQIFIIKP